MVNCKFCQKQFKTINALNAHVGQKHKEELFNSKVIIEKTKDELDITYKELQEKRLAHSNRCDICGKVETANTHPNDKTTPNALCVDHDHNLKRFRGFLCVQCNRNFGWYDKYKDKIIEHEQFKHV